MRVQGMHQMPGVQQMGMGGYLMPAAMAPQHQQPAQRFFTPGGLRAPQPRWPQHNMAAPYGASQGMGMIGMPMNRSVCEHSSLFIHILACVIDDSSSLKSTFIQEPLTTAMLAAAPMQEQKQMLGERIFPLIQVLMSNSSVNFLMTEFETVLIYLCVL